MKASHLYRGCPFVPTEKSFEAKNLGSGSFVGEAFCTNLSTYWGLGSFVRGIKEGVLCMEEGECSFCVGSLCEVEVSCICVGEGKTKSLLFGKGSYLIESLVFNCRGRERKKEVSL